VLIAEIIRAWGDLRASMRRQLDRQPGEALLLVYVMLAGVLGVVISVPDAIEQSRNLAEEDALTAVLAGRLFGAIFMAPLVFYGVAALLCFAARRLRVGITYYQMRVAVFWSLLVVTPVLMLVQILKRPAELIGAGAPLQLAGFAVFCWVLSAMIAEAAPGTRRGWVFLWLVAPVLLGVAAFVTLSPG